MSAFMVVVFDVMSAVLAVGIQFRIIADMQASILNIFILFIQARKSPANFFTGLDV